MAEVNHVLIHRWVLLSWASWSAAVVRKNTESVFPKYAHHTNVEQILRSLTESFSTGDAPIDALI